ncbi:GvpL/GvpF family gas vesicle protein [Streptantibioticus rubrisoli]|uniref:GvpL/GvpF family gas vesicle protein n=1 Tax=Streptantibioticus rubrisoli TaxID=1387313 RepID=A0ABT1PEH2_9ACTN|nr:GvpL/GvpF family gas vesicle protein [Streptantibioticus rubrisoli]MCQ4043724.1 GvpL/GvpF family gas vesicle protein [Streptantibioticus rubrisoli]
MSTYVYAITSADHPLRLNGVKGVGDPAGELRALGTQALSAVVSDAPVGLRAKRRDLAAHQGVLERLLADGAVLPMRFGLVAPDDEQVLTALDNQRDAFVERLRELDGCVEFNLKASRDEDALLREIVAESEEVRRLNEFTRQNPDAHEQKVALGELLSAEIDSRNLVEAQRIVAQLESLAVRHRAAEQQDANFLNVSFLVKRDNAEPFSQAVWEEAERRGAEYSLSLNGPLPPYSFV